MNIETRQVLMQHNFGVADWGISGRLKMCWCGSQLLVAAKLVVTEVDEMDLDGEEDPLFLGKEEVSLFCWQEKAADLLPIGISIKLDKPLYLIDMCANLQEITMIMRENTHTEDEGLKEKDHIYKYVMSS